MCPKSDWLPELVLFENFNGNWENYLEALYGFFKIDFLDSRPIYNGLRLALKKYPLVKGKEATFWHIIAEGAVEAERTPDLRRCERIRWPKPIIELCRQKGLKIWKNKRHGNTRICLWCESDEYLVILDERPTYTLFWTAYLITRDHHKRKLEREYQAYNASAAP
jgi:hypothetical protein